jgi:hypothetical protein
MPRYVVLRHLLPEGAPRASHWDLMFESGASLRTWAVEHQPDALEIGDALELADHRLAYLDYEGPVSEDRGSVARWDAGTYQVIESGRDRWQARMAGGRLRGTIVLERTAPGGHSWRVSFAAAPSLG